MSLRWIKLCALPLGFFLAGPFSAGAFAKPPGLPLNQKFTCHEAKSVEKDKRRHAGSKQTPCLGPLDGVDGNSQALPKEPGLLDAEATRGGTGIDE
jgi:hypothetical protein